MPTDRPRTQITHTPQVERALALAGQRWPGEKPGALLLHLIAEGADALQSGDETVADEHRRRVREMAGKYDDLYEPGYLENVREGWPE
jgi:hypothetical protein